VDWKISDLEEWDDKICKIANLFNLDWFPINYEICDYYEMIGHMSYHGLPSHYPHWSYGKSFERTHQMYNLGVEGLPYELIINSNPSIAYLMMQNPMYLQILIMSHCVGHSDFFKNNRIFENTFAESMPSRFRNARKRIQKYSEDPNIGLRNVESFLDSLHTIRFQTERNRRPRLSRDKIKLNIIEKYNRDKEKDSDITLPDVKRRLLSCDKDLLTFLIEYGTHFDDWELDILNIVKEESQYFIPQVQTKILNEGWACFWHYKIMNELNLPQEFHIPFLKSHNQVIRPHLGAINPYHLGFYIFNKIEKKMGIDECFFIREVHNDVSAIRMYLEYEDFRDLNLFSYSNKKDTKSIDEISDNEGWKKVKDSLLKNIGDNGIPRVIVSDISNSGDLILQHDHDGRDLDLDYADNVVASIKRLWDKDVKFFTIIEEEPWEI
jgi:stage V sporulation protein R